MRKMMSCYLIALTCTLFISAAYAGMVTSKGMATIPYSGWKPHSAEYDKAILKAKLNAIERYFSDSNSAEQKNYEIVRDKIATNIDDYVIDYAILSKSVDKDTKHITVVIKADLNANRLKNVLESGSAIANTAKSQRSLLTFVFVARQQSSVKHFKDKTYTRNDTRESGQTEGHRSHRGNEGEQIGSHNIQTSENEVANHASNHQTSQISVSGGSVTRKADVIDWKIMPSEDIDSVMTGVFSNAGYEVVEAQYLEQETNNLLNLANFRSDYSKGNDLSAKTLLNAVKGVKSAGIPYLAIGTLDVGMQGKDPVSGLERVYVTVTGKILNVSGRFPRTMSSVGPVQFAGMGPTVSVARTNALKLAAKKAANKLMNELNAQDFQ